MILSIEAKAENTSTLWPPESTSSTVSRNASNLPLASGSSMYSGMNQTRMRADLAQTRERGEHVDGRALDAAFTVDLSRCTSRRAASAMPR